MHTDPRVQRVWPTPEDGHHYVRQSLPGGVYVSTGTFPERSVDHKGRGRTFENVAQVTSLFFDADLLPLYDAARRARGAVLERRARDRKQKLYTEKPAVIEAFKQLLLKEIVPMVESTVGAPPTLVVDSGWGYHVHYAVIDELGADKDMLRTLAQGVVTEANRRAYELCQSMRPSIEVEAAFDPTFDVGCRLARMPGSQNTKAPGQPRPVTVVASSDTVLDHDLLGKLQQELMPSAQLELEPDNVPTVKPRQHQRVEVDFRSQRLPDGRTWQQVVAALGPGERVKVVCPFGGSTVGSGFFHVEADGRARYWSGPSCTTYWNSHVVETRSGLAQLVRLPKKKNQTQGSVANTVTNLLLMLEHDSTWDLWYDSFAQREMNGAEVVQDTMWVDILTHMETAYGWSWRVGKDTLWSAVEVVAHRRERNPVVEYLQTLQWDGCPRIQRWLVDGAGAEDTELNRTYGRRWFIGLIARALKPGCKLDTMLVLTGPQGYGKSSVFRELMELPGLPQLFADTRFNLRDKDAYLQLYSAWVYEDAELAGSSAADQETKKAFLSSAIDRIRPPYGRKVRTYKRHTVVVGTTNEQSFLKDRTGSRRYWVVEVDGKSQADLEWIRRWRDQLLAEAMVAYANGEQWWLTSTEELYQQKHNCGYEWSDWYTECAHTVYINNGGGWANRFTVGQFARSIDDRMNPQRLGISLSKALRRAGFSKRRSNGVIWYYIEGNEKHHNNGLIALRGIHETSQHPTLTAM